MNRRQAILGTAASAAALGRAGTAEAQELIRRWGNGPSPAPADAETFLASEHSRVVEEPSKFIPGKTVKWTEYFCPACGRTIYVDHGDTFRCECGLYLELHGNALTVWR